MNRYELSKEALADLDELWLYIAEDSIDAATRTTDAILDACALLGKHPQIGRETSPQCWALVRRARTALTNGRDVGQVPNRRDQGFRCPLVLPERSMPRRP